MDLKRFATSIAFLILSGCGQPPQAPIPLSEAHQKFLFTCQEEFQLSPIVKPEGNTLWIYLPLKENLITSQAAAQGAQKSSDFDTKNEILYADGRFDRGNFLIQYDIASKRAYRVTPGYSSTMSERFQKLQQKILLAFQKAYFDTSEPLEIVVLVISDIVSGIEVETYMHVEDLKQSMSIIQTLAAEESSKRFISEIRGDTEIIGDETGEHIPARDIPMGEFLAKQIVQRINFKYTQSAFPPSHDTPSELAEIIRETFQAYKFKDFESVMLEDLGLGKIFQVGREELIK